MAEYLGIRTTGPWWRAEVDIDCGEMIEEAFYIIQ